MHIHGFSLLNTVLSARCGIQMKSSFAFAVLENLTMERETAMAQGMFAVM